MVIGVASTAPGYSLAASLGLVTVVVGLSAHHDHARRAIRRDLQERLGRAAHGEHPLTGAVLGSVPHKLLHLSDVPVLVVPGTASVAAANRLQIG